MTQAAHVIKILGGLTAAARILDVHPSTIQGWLRRGFIPAHRHKEVIGKARRAGRMLSFEDFFV